jgi:hypothetical protein
MKLNQASEASSSSSVPVKEVSYPAAFIGREGAIKEFQNRLVLLNHAANCQFSNAAVPKPCRGFPSCYDMVQLLNHVNSCELTECPVPHCVSTRYLLAHNKSCTKDDCIVCKPLKDSIKRKNERNRNVVTVLKRKREDNMGGSVDELSPMGTPRVAESEENEGRRKAELATSGESESDTTSQMSTNIYNALASESLFFDQTDEILETMNECLNIPDTYIPPPQPFQQPLQPASQQQSRVPPLPLSFVQQQLPPQPTKSASSSRVPPLPIPALPLNMVNQQQIQSQQQQLYQPEISPRMITALSQLSTNSPRIPQQQVQISPRLPQQPSPRLPQQQVQISPRQQPQISPRLPQNQIVQITPRSQSREGFDSSRAYKSPRIDPTATITPTIIAANIPAAVSANSFGEYHCDKCRVEISKGYRYFCELCNSNICSDCFHCEDGLPHEHPVRAVKIDSLNAMINQLLS